MYSKLEQVLIKCAKSDSYEKELVECCLFYDNDFDVSKLRTQLQTFTTLWKEHNHDTSCLLLSDIINYFRTLSRPEILLMSEVARLLKLIIVMPATNAASERSFSAMRRLKTYLRTNMSKSRLNNLMMLHVHKTEQIPWICFLWPTALRTHHTDKKYLASSLPGTRANQLVNWKHEAHRLTYVVELCGLNCLMIRHIRMCRIISHEVVVVQ